MTIRTKQARAKRSALRATVVLMFAGAAIFGVSKSGALSGVLGWLTPSAAAQQEDSVQLNALMARVRGVDPVVCNLIGRALDNRFGGFSFRIYAWESLEPGEEALIEWVNRASIRESMVPTLRRSLNDPDACTRRIAARFLGRAEILDLSVQLTAELASSDPLIREAALLAIGHFDRVSGLDEARRALEDASANVRIAAAWALGMIENSDAVPALTDALADADVRVRIQAAFALGQIESESAMPALIRLLETDRDPRVRRAAAAAIGQISG